MNRLRSYIFQFGQVVTSLAGIIQEFKCCRLFKQHERQIYKCLRDSKLISFLGRHYFGIQLIKEMFQLIAGLISLVKIPCYVSN